MPVAEAVLFLLLRAGFDLGLFRLGFVVDNVALGQAFSGALPFPSVSHHSTSAPYLFVIRRLENRSLFP